MEISLVCQATIQHGALTGLHVMHERDQPDADIIIFVYWIKPDVRPHQDT